MSNPEQAALPWFDEAWQVVYASRHRPPSAWLIHGAQGLGKTAFARDLAQATLCEAPLPNGRACQRCSSCLWFSQGNHPDFRALGDDGLAGVTDGPGEATDPAEIERAPGTPGGSIGIDEVRGLFDFVYIASHRAGTRVVLIHDANALTLPAANALLKTLEEPPESVLFILVTDALNRLPATIVSRCRRLEVSMPSPELALKWLAQQGVTDAAALLNAVGGAPLRALALAHKPQAVVWGLVNQLCRHERLGDPAWPIQLTDGLAQSDPIQVIDTLQRWVVDLAYLAQGAASFYFPAQFAAQQALARRMNPAALHAFYAELAQARRLATHPLNARLRFEALFFGYQACFKR